MSNINITDNKNLLTKTCSISLTVIFFILSFLTGFNNIVIFILGILTLGLSILLTYRKFKEFNYYTLGIILVPLLSYGIIMSLSYFSSMYYSISTRVFITINILLFAVAGYFSRKIEGFDFKWIFRGILLSLSIMSLVNVIVTSVYLGPFYGLRIANYYAYYDGAASRVTVGATAYAIVGYEIKQVPIEYYLLFPLLLLTAIPLYLLGDKKDKFNIISNACFTLVALISIIFVISKVSLIFVALYLVFISLLSVFLLFKKLYRKETKYVLYGFFGLFVLFAVFFYFNSQYHLTGLRNFFSSNRVLNYVFNTNRYSENARVILNAIISKEKLIGFPIYYDYDFLYLATPSNNILVNQFMYGGVFAFIFFLLIIGSFVYLFRQVNARPLENKEYKYFPLLFVISYFVLTMIVDQNSYDLFDYTLMFTNYLSPFFYISLFVIGHYYSLTSEEVKKNEE